MKHVLSLIVFFALFTLSCQKKESKMDDVADLSVIKEGVFSRLMTPGEAAAKLQAIGADFNGTLMNDSSKWTQYSTSENKAAANLGIYLSDLNYSVAYKQRATTKGYFNAAMELATTLGAKKEVLSYLMKRYQDNINQDDSVRNVLSQLFTGSTSQLKDTDKERLAGIAFSAYYVENLHIVLGIILTYPKDILPDDARTTILVPAFKLALEQEDKVKLIYNYLKATAKEDNPDYMYFKTAFEDLIATYEKLDVGEKMKNNQVKDLLNDAVVKELSDRVNQIRDKVTGLN